MHLRASLVVHHHQFCFVQVEHIAKLFGNLKLVSPVPRGEGLLVSNPNKFLRIGLDIAALRNGQAERRCSQDIGDKPKTFPIPRIQVWTGAFLERQFQGEERLLTIESHSGGALGPVEPMHQERIQLLIFPHPHLHRQALHRPDQAQSARFDLDLAADPAGVGTVPKQFHLHLRIAVATLIAQVTQAPIRQGDNHIRIAVHVKISEVDFRHRAAIEFIEAELGCLFLKSGKTEIAPHPDFFSNRPEVQPSIIIVIDCHDLAETLDPQFWTRIKTLNRPLTRPSGTLSTAEGERVPEGRVRGRFKVLMRVQNWGSRVSARSWQSITIMMDGWTSGRLEKKSGCGAISVFPDFRNKQPNSASINSMAARCRKSTSLILTWTAIRM